MEEYGIRRRRMEFMFKVWKLSITVDLFDLNLTDSDIAFSVTISWK